MPRLSLLGLLALWISKQVFGSLIAQQVKGSVPGWTAKRVEAAVELLPDELRDECRADWLAELTTLEDKPITALRFALGLRRAARGISFRQTTGEARTFGAGALAGWRALGTKVVRLSGVDAGNLQRKHIEFLHGTCASLALVSAAVVTLRIEMLSLSSTVIVRTALGCLFFATALVIFYGVTVLWVFWPVVWRVTRENQAESRLT